MCRTGVRPLTWFVEVIRIVLHSLRCLSVQTPCASTEQPCRLLIPNLPRYVITRPFPQAPSHSVMKREEKMAVSFGADFDCSLLDTGPKRQTIAIRLTISIIFWFKSDCKRSIQPTVELFVSETYERIFPVVGAYFSYRYSRCHQLFCVRPHFSKKITLQLMILKR